MRCNLFLCLSLLTLAVSASHILRFAQEDLRPNQYLIFDDDDTNVLIDTGEGTLSGSNDLVSFIHSQGIDKLQTIFITHGHPDHYGGIPILAEAFPEAVIEVANQGVLDELVSSAASVFPTVEYNWAENIQIHEDDETFDELDLIMLSDFVGAESSFYAMVYNADANYIITGDALVTDFHPYLGTGVTLTSLRNWYSKTLVSLSNGGSLGLNRNTIYYPGHGPQGDFIQVDILIEYLQEFDNLVLSCPNTEFPIKLETVRDRLIEDYPLFEGVNILDFMVSNEAWKQAQTADNPCAFFDQFSSDNAAGALTFSLMLFGVVFALL